MRPQFRKPGQQQQDIDALRGRLQAQLVRQAVPGPAPGTVATRAAMQAPRRQGRPLWRVISGAAALGVGVGVAGLGISALVVNGQCVQQPVPPAQRCDDLYATTGIGAGLLSAGLALAVAGTVLWAWP